MKINRDELERASWDARVELNTEEKEYLLECAQALFDQLNTLPAGGLDSLKAVCYGHEQPNVTREDIEQSSLPLEKALSNAPDADDYCFHVPRIVEE